jgi:archaellum component FlaF (FlaF/FlaG flagellin family)
MILVVTTNGIFVIDAPLITLMLDGKIVTQTVRKQMRVPLFLSTASKHGWNR